MSYDPHIHHRHSLRLKGYDYSQAGLYFITICVQDRVCLFGNVGAPLVGAQNDGIQNNMNAQNGRPQGHAPTGATMILNDSGKMIESEWLKLTERFRNIELHEFVIMPNHFHGILQIVDTDNGRQHGQPRGIAPTNP